MARRISSLFNLGGSQETKETSAYLQNGLSPSDTAPSRSPVLRKSHDRSRQSSGQYLAPTDPTQPSLHELQQGIAQDSSLAQLGNLPPPQLFAGVGGNSRSSSLDRSRPGTPNQINRSTTPVIQLPEQTQSSPTADGEKLKKKRWGKNGKKEEERGPTAWIIGKSQKVSYDAQGLKNAKPMPELWNEVNGNCFVYLFPRTSNKGPSFKIDSAVLASSPELTKLAFGDVYSSPAVANGDRKQMPLDARAQRLTSNYPATPPRSPKQGASESVSNASRDSRGQMSNFSEPPETSLYLPIKLRGDTILPGQRPTEEDLAEDLQTLVDYRNFFAFLVGQSLVATERRQNLFPIFMTISGILKSFNFSNVDGSTYGEVASATFEKYVEELGLADVRFSREKTIEGIVLGERMKSVTLYNEAFTHGAGKYNDLLELKSPKFDMITPITQNRLARAAMDLDKRLASIRSILTHFEFPHLFSGIMSSKSSAERKNGVRFDAWKESFFGMRKFMLALMKQKYGSWPPKASSKKNTLETSGLNRLVLRDLYHDLSSMYDLLVDKTNLTTRTIDGIDFAATTDSPTVRGLRMALSEYDRSSPPVKPPIPFDLPLIPSLCIPSSDPLKPSSKKLKDDEPSRVLRRAWNESAHLDPFVDVFRDMERRAANNSTLAEIDDLRVGQWIFMYACLQALPMLALDAPGLRWRENVEYFLCEPPRSGVPWADPSSAGAGTTRRQWFSIAGASGVVSLPSDLVEHGVEGIYRRSHAWRMAEKWAGESTDPGVGAALRGQLQQQQQQQGQQQRGLRPGSASGGGGGRGNGGGGGEGGLMPPGDERDSSGGGGQQQYNRLSKRQSSLALGLEALPLPAGVTPDGSAPTLPDGLGKKTPRHSVDASRTFDAILGNIETGNSGNNSGKSGKKGRK